jgi:beta-mannosidase
MVNVLLSEVVLGGLWRFKGYKGSDGEEQRAYATDAPLEGWLLAEAPLTAHTNLMDNKLIPDPFKGCNEREVQWVTENEWWYRKEIDLTEEVVSKDAVELYFGGLDTYATIWVNNAKVGEANNMFIPWRFNIKPVAKAGKNLIAIRFKPVLKVASEIEAKHKYKYACLSAENFSARPYVRKAQYSFGWDWGPTLPTAGIWREAKIVAYNEARLGYVAASPIEVSAQKAKMKLTAEIHASGESELRMNFLLSGFGQRYEKDLETKVKEGRNFADCTFEFSTPKLWWPRGYGDPNLYDASFKLYSGAELLDYAAIKVGIRSIQLIQEPDEEGKTFIFNINDQNVFCKGANWIPADSFLPKVNYEIYNKLLTSAAESNFNMLRVWGGGVYEADDFYDLCDALGIMVWQDFMYVCAGYPEEEWFLKDAEREAMEAILRLRRHPSIVVWCGNNENQWLQNVLWKSRDKVQRLYGSEIFDTLLAKICQSLDPTRPYRPSSPFGGEDASGRHEGDRHNWDAWSKGLDYTTYLEDNGRFISEFGWQAPPTIELLRSYLEEEDLTPDSYAFRAHEKQTGGMELLRALLAVHYPVPNDMRRFVLYSQLNQGEALKTAVTHWRSRMFRTSGCLIWQFNDCWPVISWSLIDYGLHPKAAYFYVKRAYQPIISPIIVRQGRVEVYAINETAEPLDANLKYEVLTFGGEAVYDHIVKAIVAPYTSRLMFEKTLDELPTKSNCIMTATLQHQGAFVCGDIKTVAEPKELHLPLPKIQISTKKLEEKTFEVTFQAPVYVKAAKIELSDLKVKFSDNFFDLHPNIPKVVFCRLEHDLTAKDFEKNLTVQFYPYT